MTDEKEQSCDYLYNPVDRVWFKDRGTSDEFRNPKNLEEYYATYSREQVA